MNTKNLDARVRIGHRIFLLRKEQGMTQEDLAEKANISRANLSRIESGSYGTSLDILANLAQVLGKTLDIV